MPNNETIIDNKTIEELEDLFWELVANGYSIKSDIIVAIKDKIEYLKSKGIKDRAIQTTSKKRIQKPKEIKDK